jgi:DNA-binding protein HU-beta
VNKTELIERIADEAGMTKAEAQKHFEAFTETVTEALKGGKEVQITGFGKFESRERSAREGVNPQTGEKMHIAAKRVPAFSAGNALKDSIR